MSNLLESSSMEDVLDSETSVTPSPVPSLTDVLRSTAKLEPGLAAKPPIPPMGGGAAKKNKSMDDIINIKFQRWFPESVQNAPPYMETLAAMTNGDMDEAGAQCVETFESELLEQPGFSEAKSGEGLLAITNGEGTSRDFTYPSIKFDAYEGARVESSMKTTAQSRTMETIEEGEDTGRHDSPNVKADDNNTREMLTSKVGKTLNKYLGEDSKERSRKNSTHSKDPSEESGIVSMIEQSDSPAQVMSHLLSDGPSSPSRQAMGIAKVLEDENAACLVNYMDQSLLPREDQGGSQNRESGMKNEDILSWMGRNQVYLYTYQHKTHCIFVQLDKVHLFINYKFSSGAEH